MRQVRPGACHRRNSLRCVIAQGVVTSRFATLAPAPSRGSVVLTGIPSLVRDVPRRRFRGKHRVALGYSRGLSAPGLAASSTSRRWCSHPAISRRPHGPPAVSARPCGFAGLSRLACPRKARSIAPSPTADLFARRPRTDVTPPAAASDHPGAYLSRGPSPRAGTIPARGNDRGAGNPPAPSVASPAPRLPPAPAQYVHAWYAELLPWLPKGVSQSGTRAARRRPL